MYKRMMLFMNTFKIPCFTRLLMEELVNFMERVPKAQSATCWKKKEIQRSVKLSAVEKI